MVFMDVLEGSMICGFLYRSRRGQTDKAREEMGLDILNKNGNDNNNNFFDFFLRNYIRNESFGDEE